MKYRKILLLSLLMLGLAFLLSGCVPGDGANSLSNQAGFFTGVWHGWLAPFSLIYSIFNRSIGIYESFNTGFMYDLGYYMAIISGFGGLTLSRKNIKKARSQRGQ